MFKSRTGYEGVTKNLRQRVIDTKFKEIHNLSNYRHREGQEASKWMGHNWRNSKLWLYLDIDGNPTNGVDDELELFILFEYEATSFYPLYVRKVVLGCDMSRNTLRFTQYETFNLLDDNDFNSIVILLDKQIERLLRSQNNVKDILAGKFSREGNHFTTTYTATDISNSNIQVQLVSNNIIKQIGGK